MRRRLPLILGALLLAAGLAGCGSGSEGETASDKPSSSTVQVDNKSPEAQNAPAAPPGNPMAPLPGQRGRRR